MSTKAETRLLSAIGKGRAPHACFIACPDISQSERIARRAAALFCAGSADNERLFDCADYFELGGEPYRIDDIHAIIDELHKRPFGERGARAVFFKNADRMDEKCQNALLKTLEEPPKNTLFLLTGNEAGLLPTIRSRCSLIRTGMPKQSDTVLKLQELGAAPDDAQRFAALGDGVCERSIKLFCDPDFKALRDHAIQTLVKLLSGDVPFSSVKAIAETKSAQEAATFMLSFMRDMLLLKQGLRIKCNVDLEEVIVKLCDRFTMKQINCIIELLMDTKRRLALNIPQGTALDRLFAMISEEAIKR